MTHSCLKHKWKCNNPYNVKQSYTGCLLSPLSLPTSKHSLFNSFIRYTLCYGNVFYHIITFCIHSPVFLCHQFCFVNKCLLEVWAQSLLSVTVYALEQQSRTRIPEKPFLVTPRSLHVRVLFLLINREDEDGQCCEFNFSILLMK